MSDDTRSFEDVQEDVTGDFTGWTQVLDGGGDSIVCQHTTGTIDGYEFALRLDGDAPDALVADIEAQLAECKAERENDE